MSDSRRLLLHAFPTFSIGGAQSRFVQLANAFGPRYRHVIVSMDHAWEACERLSPLVQWQRLELPNRRGSGLANRAAFRGALARVAPDLLLSYNWGAIEWAAANLPRRVPQVHVEDGFGADEAAGQFARRVWTRRLLLGLRGIPVVVPSATLRDAATGWWVRQNHLLWIPNGVPVPDAASRAPRAPGPIVIGTVAALRPEKNLSRLLRAVAVQRARHNLRLLIVGEGSERPRLTALADELGLCGQVEFTGYLADPRAALHRMDLFALSSDTEQLPISMLEAMAEGVAVIATRVGDVPELMPPVAHRALSAPNDHAFAEALGEVLDAIDQWPQWVAEGRTLVRERYAFERMLARWKCLFDGQREPGGAVQAGLAA